MERVLRSPEARLRISVGLPDSTSARGRGELSGAVCVCFTSRLGWVHGDPNNPSVLFTKEAGGSWVLVRQLMVSATIIDLLKILRKI